VPPVPSRCRERAAHRAAPSCPPPARALAVGLVVGVALGVGTPAPALALALVLGGGAALLLLRGPQRGPRRSPQRARYVLALGLAAAAVGVLRGGASLPAPARAHAPRSGTTGEEGVVRGVVDAAPSGRINANGDVEQRVVLRLPGHRRAVVRVGRGLRGETFDAAAGDSVEISGRVILPSRPGNPGERDRRASLRRAGTVLFLRAAGPAAVRQLGTRQDDLRAFALRLGTVVRRNALRRLRAACGGDGPTFNVLACLLVGERSRLDEETLHVFRRAGAAHLLAVSGLHVILLVGAVSGLMRRAADRWMPGRGGRAVALLGSLTALVIYALTCRLATPVVRASVFVAVALLARAAGRRTSTADHLAIAAAVIAAAAPAEVLAAGFQLSFTAVAGLCWLTPRFREALFAQWDLISRFPEALPAWRLRLMQGLASGLSATLAAATATAPISALVFGEVHPASPLTNLVAVPIVGVLLPATAVAAFVGDAATLVTAPCLDLGAALLAATVRGVSALPGASLSAGGSQVGVALSIALLLGALMIRPWRRRHLLLPLAAWLVLLPTPAPTTPAASGPGALVLDVGHGLAVLMRGGGGGTLLMDAGSRLPGAAERVLVPTLAAVGVRRLTVLAISHEDTDHCGAAHDLLAALPVGVVLVPVGFGGDPAGRRVLRACKRHRVPVIALARGDEFATRDVRGRVLLPLAGRPGPAQNEGSLVLHVTAGDPRLPPADRLSALLPGDLEGPTLDALAEDPTLPTADLLVLAHHGRGVPAPHEALARRLAARVLVASTSRAAPTRVPGAWSTGIDGALWIAPRRAPESLRPGTE